MPIRALPLLAYLRRPALIATGDGRLPAGFLPAMAAALTATIAASAVLSAVSGLIAGLAILVAAGFGVGQLMRWHYPHRSFGACNLVTFLRAALTAALVSALVAGQAGGWAVALVATLALTLDGVDGWLARRSGLASEFGARFDMEVDAALALVLALHALMGSPIGAEVLFLGLMRYVFVIAGIGHHAFREALPPSFLRKAICVFQLATLILLQIPQLPPDAGIIVGRIAAAALIWSFGTDMIWLWRHR